LSRTKYSWGFEKEVSSLDQTASLQTTMLFQHLQSFQKVMNETMTNLGSILIQSPMQAIEQTPLKTPMKTLMHTKVNTSTHKA
jgi:hypothetical protein